MARRVIDLSDEQKARQQANEARKNKASTLKTLTEVLNRQVQHEWLISRYIERRQTVILFGESGTWKSLLGLDMTCCIGYALRWRDHKTTSGAVLYIVGEGGGGGLTRRLKAWHIVNKPPEQEAPVVFRELATLLPDDLEALIEEVTEFLRQRGWKLEMVILDTLARTMNGNENSQEDFSKYQRAIDTLRDTYECAVMIIHHSGHGDKSRPKGTYGLIGNPDVILQMEKLDDRHCKLIARKIKDAELPEDIVFQLTPVELGESDDEGRPVTSVVLRHLSDPNNPPTIEKPISGRHGMGRNAHDALKILKRIECRQRKNLDGGDHPNGVVRVTEKDWHDEYCSTLKGMSPKVKQVTFFKARRELVNNDKITLENGFVFTQIKPPSAR